ncbi:MAG: heavy-metal-associated domain-containing protein [Chloroflexi bacterium]|nr:heavy-metal-associated domain-containing protein [Chloroflexota bacterium]MCY3584011.1 heavy-metal-associated domain-containing protein [Chloroflexota bacterium]MCY3716653.1 heavy-metal-associated domain-containing protein [Chloroflexota bacterium]MDE2649399.1 heavy-metal-associated domain-containing protein [Chloroflexota bacterium]MXV93011.1 cation transporter [Chloroflexota bacterium]
MPKETFTIPKIHCAGCVGAIKFELGELPGVTTVEGDMLRRRIEVEYTAPATLEGIVALLHEINYPPQQDN